MLIKFSIVAGLLGAVQAVHAQGFALGLVLGLVINGGGSHVPSDQMRQMGLSAIPLRCLATQSEADYTDCRWVSMMAELQAARNNTYRDITTPFCTALLGDFKSWKSDNLYAGAIQNQRACDIRWHIDLEIKALNALNSALASKPPR